VSTLAGVGSIPCDHVAGSGRVVAVVGNGAPLGQGLVEDLQSQEAPLRPDSAIPAVPTPAVSMSAADAAFEELVAHAASLHAASGGGRVMTTV